MKKLLIILTIMLLFVGLHAQETTTASGGEASGDGGTVSYSVGQVVYGTHSGTTGSVSEGIQQPYEISVIIGLEETGINLNISAFPNPTTDYLILKIADDAHQESRFTITLYDLNGRVIEQQVVVSYETAIDMASLNAATYILKVNNDNQEVKTFKIIKNQ
jgi:hypothetical protein